MILNVVFAPRLFSMSASLFVQQRTVAAATVELLACEKTGSFLSFPYVCPEPVLVK
jgi:hypothetical protein